MFDAEDGASELVIENLENLKETTALIVKRHGTGFKIGIASDDVTKGYSLPAIDERPQSIQAKVMLRGKVGNHHSKNDQQSKDNFVYGNNLHQTGRRSSHRSHRSQISGGSKDSHFARITQKQIITQNRFQTF